MNQTKTVPDFVGKRNKRLEQFFKAIGYDVYDIRIVGNENAPAVLYRDTYILPCYVHNFELKWTDKQFNGTVLKTYKLTAEVPDVRKEVDELISTGELKQVYKVGTTNSNLFLIGWNYLDKDNKKHKFPVFGRYAPKIYYTTEKANEVLKELQDQGYSCRII